MATALLVVLLLACYNWPLDQRPDETLSTRHHRRYQSTQFISFTINTLGGLADKGECVGRQVDPDYEGKETCYLGSFDISKDIAHRMRIVEQVLHVIKSDRTSDDPEIDHDSSVLKILALPEFYLRGPVGAYSINHLLDDRTMLEVSDRMKDLIKDEYFSDYLFLFGTIIFATTGHDTNLTLSSQLEADQVEYWNYAPMARGGPNVTKYLVEKQYVSTVDFLDRTVLPNPATTHTAEYSELPKDLVDLMKKRGTSIESDSVIEIDGLRIGVEICLDHRMGVLWDKLQADNEPLVDVLLITSAGMAIERGPNPLRPGGVVYLSDGEASSAACVRTDHGKFDPETVCRVPGPSAIKHVPPRNSEFITLSGCIDFMNRTDLLEGYYSLHQTQGCAYTLELCKSTASIARGMNCHSPSCFRWYRRHG